MTEPPQRAIDAAMRMDRADKATVRQWWMDSVRQMRSIADEHDVPFYFTLPGGEGRDIRLLIDEGIIRVTEAGAIDGRDAERIVAVESSMPACGKLKKNFPGLQVREIDVKSLLSGNASHTFPAKDIKRQCRATVINLDYNGPWKANDEGLIAIDKFARIHQGSPEWPPVDWTLCLTFRADLVGPREEKLSQVKFLQDQVADDERLSKWTEDHLGTEILELENNPESIDAWSDKTVQLFLCVLVPLKLVHLGCSMGWGVSCIRSAIYGGGSADGEPTAAMVTFLVDFADDPSVKASPLKTSKRYRSGIAASMCQVAGDGSILPIA